MKCLKKGAAVIAVCLAALTASGAAYAEERTRGVIAGRSLLIGMMAVASAGASVTQQGRSNSASIAQDGQGNAAAIRQFGHDNNGAIAQEGSNNAACLIQFGHRLDGAIVQTGDDNSLGVIQSRRGVRYVPPEVCAFGADNRGAIESALRRGVRNGR